MITRNYLRTRKDGVKLYTTSSSLGLKIRQEQTGAVFDEAVDVENAPYTYTETDEPVAEPEERSEYE